LPIPNRTVKRLSADDSAGSRVKVGHRQALTAKKAPTNRLGLFSWQKQNKKQKAPCHDRALFLLAIQLPIREKLIRQL
ncbi:hypothetical protein, partial [Variovorax sp. PDC80]|uniref:hypothetical protein n=1 Tax=Variovorax sp. PDC80 TaxID=1882827 RepID=UPI001C4302BD